ncbi:PGF-CTERM-anchored ABC transporter substrate-binding protein [Salinilacihabitans rarus]|uniref:PGF-CTERM-anchored ABC transporter substrate-binding protein n=1 Tax=Salinilacihabitans rarus TaxID=2961596 RepID=UPI0020C86AF6|nr:PGF-CTERM-anchored ABC transporter substrate-binding protein [Salinilacihabitans rarus]
MRRSLILTITTLAVLAAVAPAPAAASAATTNENGFATAAQADADCEYPIELTDATGERVPIEERPESVVALQPSNAQTVFAIGAEDRLDGAPHNPATADLDLGDRADVSDEYDVVAERVIDLEPDVVLAANVTPEDDVETLREAGLTVYHFRAAESLDDVREDVLVTGRLTGTCDGAAETVDWMDRRLAVVETAVEGEERPLAYYEMGEGYTAGEGTFQHEVLTTAGLENLAVEADIRGWGQLNEETIVDANPEWIVYPDRTDEPVVAEGVRATTAFQEGNAVAVDDNNMSQPTPNVVYALEEIVAAVHPEAYAEAEAELEAQAGSDVENGSTDESDGESDDATAGGDDGETGTEAASEDDTLPGFGAPVAVAALLAVLGALARRR